MPDPNRTIVAAIDFSPASKNAFQYALHLAHALQAKLVLLHVYSEGELAPFVPISLQHALIDNQESLALDYFTRLEQEIPANLYGKVDIDFQIVLGPTVAQILRVCEEQTAALLVMGMKGGNVFSKKLLGSTPTALIQRAKQPVALIPENYQYHPIRSIGYASNFESEDIVALNQLSMFSETLNASITCIHIREKGEITDDYKLRILQSAYRHEYPFAALDIESKEAETVVKGLQQYIVEKEIDMLVMLTHKRSIINQIFHQSQSKKMSRLSAVPLWTFQMGTQILTSPKNHQALTKKNKR